MKPAHSDSLRSDVRPRGSTVREAHRDRPIGQNQATQHPLAERWIELQAAELMVFRAAAAYDRGEEAGAFANAAKCCAAEAGFRACERRS